MTPSPALRAELARLIRRRKLRVANHQSTARIDAEMKKIRFTLLSREVNKVRVRAGVA